MDEQSKFRTALAALSAYAEQKDGKLTKDDVREYLKDMEFDEGQLQLVYEFLASRHIKVEGLELPKVEAQPYTEEEEAFLKQYRKDMKAVRRIAEAELADVFSRAAGGDVSARHLLAEHYMGKMLTIAEDFAHRGLLIQDLIQEGNLGLLLGLGTLDSAREDIGCEAYLEQEIRRAMRAALDMQEGNRSLGEEVVEKLNKLADSITQLNEDLGRQVTPDELSFYLDMPLEEIERLLKIAGEDIETDQPGAAPK
ncbi:MAG: hypothetical protein LUE31_00250 [Lachnospiraceae bacterium]|nr:hypothetical protein [Lachnospiraceae bacterium]